EAKELLAAYDIPVANAVRVHTTDDAVAAARQAGYPVVLKLLSQTITHKSDVGGVQLNLADDEAVRSAFHTIQANVARHGTDTDFDGVTVQPMIRDRGH